MRKVLSAIPFLLLCSSGSPIVFAQTDNGSREPSIVAKSSPNRSAQKNSDSTESPADKTASDDSSTAQKYYDSGTALLNSGKVEEAIAALKQAVKLKPNDAQTHYMLGMAQSKAKGYRDSYESFKRAVRIKTDWPEAHFRLGIMSYVLGKKSQSVDAYNKLLKLNSPLANTLNRIIRDEKEATLAERVDSSSQSLRQADLLTRSVSIKDARNTTLTETPGENHSTTTGKPVAPVTSSAPGSASSSAEDQRLSGLYRIGVGDVLDIRFLNSATPRSTLFTVIDGGLIDLPIAGGALAVAGLTADEIQTRIVSELKRRAVEEGTRVSVGVRQYASHSVVITGLVNSPGTKFLRREAVPLYVVMAEAQARLDAVRVAIMRSGSSALVLDLTEPDALNFMVRPGDLISVSARVQEFYYIAGRIRSPGQKAFQSGMTLLQAILAAGGVLRQGENIVEVSRDGREGRLSTTKFKLKEIKEGKIQDPRVEPGDRIEVIR